MVTVSGSFRKKVSAGCHATITLPYGCRKWILHIVLRLGEVVLVDMSHGLPGLVTRDGVFRDPGPDSRVNPQTGPIFVEGIKPGDALAIDILDIKVGDWGYCNGRIFELRDGYAEFSHYSATAA